MIAFEFEGTVLGFASVFFYLFLFF